MKVSEYLPLYNLMFNFDYIIGIQINNKNITIELKAFFKEYPEYELNATEIMILDNFDLVSLNRVLMDPEFNEQNIIQYLREIFDNFRTNGGNPNLWLHKTFETVNMNPQNFNPAVRGGLEANLSLWINTYETSSNDHLFRNIQAIQQIGSQVKNKTKKGIGYKEIAMACKVLDIKVETFDSGNVLSTFKGHNCKNGRLLYNAYNDLKSSKSLTDLKVDKTASTKHYFSILKAIELVNSENESENKNKALKKLDDIKSTFCTQYQSKYRTNIE